MLTPAEELELSGLSVASRVRKAFYKIPEQALIELMQRIREESIRRHLFYMREGEPDARCGPARARHPNSDVPLMPASF